MRELLVDGRPPAEVLVLGPGGLCEHGADDLVALRSDLLPDLFFHGRSPFGERKQNIVVDGPGVTPCIYIKRDQNEESCNSK